MNLTPNHASIDAIAANGGLSAEDAARAQLYSLLAAFLSGPPSAEALAAGSQLSGDQSALGTAITAFARACRAARAEAVAHEFHDLFIGVGRGELLPYGSYYLTGFLNEKPLARLREDMARLEIVRDASVKDPEDHVASVCEIMAGLITGALGPGAGTGADAQFFEAHMSVWAEHFFSDLAASRTSHVYASLGAVGRAFIEIEQSALAMD